MVITLYGSSDRCCLPNSHSWSLQWVHNNSAQFVCAKMLNLDIDHSSVNIINLSSSALGGRLVYASDEMWLQLFSGLISVKRSSQSVCLCTHGYIHQRFQGPFTCLLLQEDLNSCVAMWLPLLHLKQKYLILPICTCSNLHGVMRSWEVWLQLKIMVSFPL